jgi:ubiquinone/menaquinone biosynthesis C-methylase UbiE
MDALLNKYDIWLNEYGPDDIRSLGWGSINNQQKRFDILKSFIKNGEAILDVGCGYGDFSSMVDGPYLGIDERENAITIAQLKYPKKAFLYTEFNTMPDSSGFDWVMASGLFSFDESEWERKTLDTIKKMYAICKIGLAVNFLSNLKNGYRKPGMKYVYPSTIMILVESISKNIVLRHDYLENDFSVCLRKQI